jgi:hypothetical protein
VEARPKSGRPRKRADAAGTAEASGQAEGEEGEGPAEEGRVISKTAGVVPGRCYSRRMDLPQDVAEGVEAAGGRLGSRAAWDEQALG